MDAVINPIIEPDMLPRTTFTGINHLQKDKLLRIQISRLYYGVMKKQQNELLPLEHFLPSDGLSELREYQTWKQK